MPILRYFNIRGRADHVRLALELAGVKYTEEYPDPGQISFTSAGPQFSGNWKDHKTAQPFGQVPVFIEDDGTAIPQSLAILQHVGRKYNLYGETETEKTEVDVLNSFLEMDVNHLYFGAIAQLGDETKRNEVFARINSKLDLLEKRVQGRTWFAASSNPTIADAMAFHWLVSFYYVLDHAWLESRPALYALVKRFANLEPVKAYLQSPRFPATFAPPGAPFPNGLIVPEKCCLPQWLFA